MVSIGIPTYNRPEQLKNALEIITGQTYSNLEIIISDNASTNEQVEIIAREYMSRDLRIKYYKQEVNIGVLANADFVLEKSGGEFFTWFSDDDWRSPEFVQFLVDELNTKPEVGFAFCDYYEVDSNGNRVPGYPLSHLKIFKPFESSSRLFRTIMYYWQDGSLGKPNLFYGLFRRRFISSLDLKKLSGNFTHLNMDCLITFSLLQKSSVTILEEAMCTLTCGNKKHYLEGRSESSSSKERVFTKLLHFFVTQKKDKNLYLKNTQNLREKFFIQLLFIPKILFLLGKIIEKKFKLKIHKNRDLYPLNTPNGQKKSLPDITLIAMATRNVDETLQALKYSCQDIEFGQVKLLAHFKPYGLPAHIKFIRISKIKNIDEWSYKIIYELSQYIETKFALLVHADGYVVNPSSWREEFLDYDYIGAPWPMPKDNFSYRDVNGDIVRVGNSVSLRSKRLLDLPIKLNLPWEPYSGYFNEDGFICVKNRHIYKAHGMKIADIEVAKFFSHEAMIPEVKNIRPFVFHKWAGSNIEYPNFQVNK
nr:DUF5672 family protein [Polynucleobacter sp. AP-RePozz3-80-G7]